MSMGLATMGCAVLLTVASARVRAQVEHEDPPSAAAEPADFDEPEGELVFRADLARVSADPDPNCGECDPYAHLMLVLDVGYRVGKLGVGANLPIIISNTEFESSNPFGGLALRGEYRLATQVWLATTVAATSDLQLLVSGYQFTGAGDIED